MPVHVGRAHGDAIVGGAGAPVDLVNKVAETGGPASGYVHGSENATVQSGTGKKRTRTVRRKNKKRRTKNKTASRSRAGGRRHKKNTMKKHSSKKHNKKARSHRRKRSVKVHKQTGKGGYALVGHEMGVGPKATYGEAKPLVDCGRL